jgi:membrane-bound lytic murein transglycosylase B
VTKLIKSAAMLMAGVCAACAAPSAVSPQPAPAARPAAAPAVARPAEGFSEWLAGFRGRARAAGISEATFDAAFRGVAPNPRVIELDGRQAEFVRPIWEYLDSAVSETRVQNGRRLAAEKAPALRAIEAQHGVEGEVALAIWGLESAYGANYGDIPVIESLATLAWEGRRRDFAEEQLLAALRILQTGDVTPERMVGSWAGAMGHTQFIPTSFEAYAVDFGGDGRRDLWSADALDALASTANYLARFGWTQGLPWGVEVRLPAGFDYALADERLRPMDLWRGRGVTAAAGGPLPDLGEAGLLLPAGAQGPAFLVTRNFGVIKRYNNATSYALAVGHLSDRIAGGGPIAADWPRGERPLSRTEKEEVQRRLIALGFDTRGVDGQIGPDSRAAIRAWQTSRGLPADGFDTAGLLAALRRETGG